MINEHCISDCHRKFQERPRRHCPLLDSCCNWEMTEESTEQINSSKPLLFSSLCRRAQQEVKMECFRISFHMKNFFSNSVFRLCEYDFLTKGIISCFLYISFMYLGQDTSEVRMMRHSFHFCREGTQDDVDCKPRSCWHVRGEFLSTPYQMSLRKSQIVK